MVSTIVADSVATRRTADDILGFICRWTDSTGFDVYLTDSLYLTIAYISPEPWETNRASWFA